MVYEFIKENSNDNKNGIWLSLGELDVPDVKFSNLEKKNKERERRFSNFRNSLESLEYVSRISDMTIISPGKSPSPSPSNQPKFPKISPEQIKLLIYGSSERDGSNKSDKSDSQGK